MGMQCSAIVTELSLARAVNYGVSGITARHGHRLLPGSGLATTDRTMGEWISSRADGFPFPGHAAFRDAYPLSGASRRGRYRTPCAGNAQQCARQDPAIKGMPR